MGMKQHVESSEFATRKILPLVIESRLDGPGSRIRCTALPDCYWWPLTVSQENGYTLGCAIEHAQAHSA